MKWVTYISVTLIVLLMFLVVSSWIVSAVMPESGINSMLSGEGIRWYVGHLTDILATHYLAWIILAAMCIGTIKDCRIAKAIHAMGRRQHLVYNERLGLQIAAVTAFILAAIVIYLIVAPNAVLLGATGRLWPSAFASGFIPIVCFITTAVGGAYGFVAGTFTSLTDFFRSMCNGLSLWAPIIVIYVVTMQLIACGQYIFR